MGKRIVLTKAQYAELVEARSWCHRRGLDGLQRWYDDELSFHAKRFALPPGSVEYRDLEEERPARPRRDY